MKVNAFSLTRATGLLAGALLAFVNVHAAEADAMPTFDSNYVKLSASGTGVDGSKAAFQARMREPKTGTVGIEDLNATYDISKDVNFEVDGRLLAGAADYLLEFKLAKNEVGSVDVGYKRFRTYYDDIGGFFPVNQQWIELYPRATYVDRGNLFANVTIALPKAPVITLHYSNETRNGVKDSTIWGDTNLTGLASTAGRKIIPAYVNLSERHQEWNAQIKQTAGNTTVIGFIGGDWIGNNDLRTIDRNVGELGAYGTFAGQPSTLVPISLAGNQARGFDKQYYRENGFTAGAKVETVVNDKVTLFAGLNYHDANIDIAGQRLVTQSFATNAGIISQVAGFYVAEPPAIRTAGRPAYSYNSNGMMTMSVWTGNIGAQLKPMPDLYVEAALKGEKYKDSGTNNVAYINNGFYRSATTVAITSVPQAGTNALDNNETPWTPSLDVRYTGIRNVALYGEFEYRTVTQDEKNTAFDLNINTAGTTPVTVAGAQARDYATHIKEKHGNVKVGANWTPVGIFSARAEVFTKDHENHFDGFGTANPTDFYYLNYDMYGAKLTATIKPTPTVAFTSRYIHQRGKASTADAGLGSIDSGDTRRHQFGETVDWNPSKAFYAQANANIVFDTIITSYPKVTGAAKDVLHNSDNNYIDGDVVLGTAVTKEADLQLRATYYRANNYDTSLVATTLPYGAGAKEYTVSAGLKYKIDAKTVASAKIGYAESVNDTTGGNTNFRGPLAYVSLEHAF